ncbi:MAG: arylsulfatase A-like enzyme, partial [Candidatus Pelagisphaera sp.]
MRAITLCFPVVLILSSLAFSQKPNIVFILADDVNYDAIGCYGGENVATPNIDRLASQGIQFNQAYSAMAMC